MKKLFLLLSLIIPFICNAQDNKGRANDVNQIKRSKRAMALQKWKIQPRIGRIRPYQKMPNALFYSDMEPRCNSIRTPPDVLDSIIKVEITKPKSQGAFSFNQNRHTIIDDLLDGEQSIGYKKGRDANTGLTLIRNSVGKYGYIDDSGKEIIPTIYDQLGNFDDGKRLAVAKRDGKYGYLKPTGQQATDFKYDKAISFNWNNRLTPVAQKNAYDDLVYGFIDVTGIEVIPLKYEFAMPFSDGLAAVCMDGKYGFINEWGNTIIDYQFDDVKWGFFEGLAWVKRNGKWGLINKDGYSIQIPNNFNFTDFVKFDYYTGWADVKTEPFDILYFDEYGEAYSSADARKQANEKLEQELAIIDWNNVPKVTAQPTFGVRVGVKSKSKIKEITINVEAPQGIKSNIHLERDDRDIVVNQDVVLNEGPNKIIFSVTNAAGTTRVENIVTYRTATSWPEVEWSTPSTTVNDSTFHVNAMIKSKSKIEDAYILVNDERNNKRSIKVVVADNYNLTLNQTVTLSEGANIIKIFVRNEAGPFTTAAKTVIYEKEKEVIQTGRRLALVMGNAKYGSDKNLENPVNDATDFAAKLRTLGFDVIPIYDKTLQEMEHAIADFGEKAKNYDVALFFYAGHGIQSQNDKINFIIPINANLESEAELRFKCVPFDLIIATLVLSKCRMKIAIFDACRDNPWEKAWHRSIGNRGFTGIETPAGIIIQFSTAPGSSALDADPTDPRHSPYMSAMLKALDIPGLSIYDVFQDVSDAVRKKTNGKQTPWIHSSMEGKFIFNKK